MTHGGLGSSRGRTGITLAIVGLLAICLLWSRPLGSAGLAGSRTMTTSQMLKLFEGNGVHGSGYGGADEYIAALRRDVERSRRVRLLQTLSLAVVTFVGVYLARTAVTAERRAAETTPGKS